MNCLHFCRTKNKRQSPKKVWENKDFCNLIMCPENSKILEVNKYQKSDKAPFVIYSDLESFIERIDGCKSNPQNSFTTKVSKYIPSGLLMSTVSSFTSKK